MTDDPFFPRPGFDFTRRAALGLFGAGALGAVLPPARVVAQTADGEELIVSHGYSYYGDLKYPADYKHWDYVNPDAPKGGEISLSKRGTFDGFNRWASKGRPESDAGVVAESMFGEMPWGGGLPADSITNAYCLIARDVEYPRNKTWCVFHMRDDVVFSNGAPLTAHDAAFTHNLFLEQGIRSYARAVKERIESVEVIDDHTIRYSFVDGISRRSLISQVGGTPIFSKDWYAETGERLDEPSLKSPMASGPYVVGDHEINRYVVYERNPNYWGWEHPANIGRHNFDRVRIEYFADEAAEFEAFKAGHYSFRAEGSTKRWATGYDFPAVKNGDVKLHTIPDGNAPTNTGIVFSTIRAPFTDKRVREALSLAFNFEWTRDSLQYGLTTQRNSFVDGTEWEAQGVPEGAEKAFFEALGDVVPPEIFTEPAVRAHESKPGTLFDRANKRQGMKILAEAGWTVADDGKLRDAAGKQMSFKFLLSSSTSDTVEALVTNYIKTLTEFWGIDAQVEKVDSAQYAQRYYDKDWDMVYFRYNTFATTGTGLKQMFGSETAVVSSYNPASLQSPLVDAIIDASLATENREDELVSLMALDRALRFERVMIPTGYVPETWIAAFDIFERPEELPPYAVGVLDFWWFNEEKFQALKAKGVLK